ncbi:hypothetical protein [Paracoccus aminovorans]|uniref:hypothetical protein n=1 Tax=Paracoccus aminovorans TaxID=34004 RepID=UPI000A48963E|nr:hypothetical protein [Paracoccus aminovorans]
MVLRHPPGDMQRTLAHFLSLGHYDTQGNRMRRAFARLREAMFAAIAHRGLWLVSPRGRLQLLAGDARRQRIVGAGENPENPRLADPAGHTLLWPSNPGRAVRPAGLFLDLGRAYPKDRRRIAAAVAESDGRWCCGRDPWSQPAARPPCVSGS